MVPTDKGKWHVVVFVAIASGLLPTSYSGIVEFLFIGLFPMYLGFVVGACWGNKPLAVKVGLVFALACLGVIVRLASSSLHDNHNWFAIALRALVSVGQGNPYANQTLLVFCFPVAVAVGSLALSIKLKVPEDTRP